ncbi:MAG TPA: cell surface protein [Phenylobacterium sp.]
MQKSMLVVTAALALALSACSRAEQRDTAGDVKAAAQEVGDKAKEAANSPEVKKMGAELKDAAGDAGKVIKETAKGAAEGAREGAAKVEAESKDAAHDRPDDAKK